MRELSDSEIGRQIRAYVNSIFGRLADATVSQEWLDSLISGHQAFRETNSTLAQARRITELQAQASKMLEAQIVNEFEINLMGENFLKESALKTMTLGEIAALLADPVED